VHTGEMLLPQHKLLPARLHSISNIVGSKNPMKLLLARLLRKNPVTAAQLNEITYICLRFANKLKDSGIVPEN
jgi:hypothetical protein